MSHTRLRAYEVLTLNPEIVLEMAEADDELKSTLLVFVSVHVYVLNLATFLQVFPRTFVLLLVDRPINKLGTDLAVHRRS